MIELSGIHIGGGDAFQTNGVSTLEQARAEAKSRLLKNGECILE